MTWKNINGYDNYSVSELGQVRNDKTGRILKPITQRSGYQQVTLSKNGVKKTYLIHRIVMNAWKPNPDPDKYFDVNHKDFNKSNNSVDNLEWTTHAENMKYGSCPDSINYIAEEIKDMVIIVLSKYISNNPEYMDKLGEKLKNSATNSLLYQAR